MGTVSSCAVAVSSAAARFPRLPPEIGSMTPDQVAAFCLGAAWLAQLEGARDTAEDWRLLVDVQRLLDGRRGWSR